MSEPRKPRHSSDFTVRLRYCKGCHNELQPGMTVCPVCNTQTPVPPAAEEPASPATDPDEKTNGSHE